MPKISIIVPVYNVETYLRQCLDSLVAQTIRDIEIIIVNDGSTDSSPQIINEYAAKDSRVKPLHQPNGGYGKAMNAGIATATGDYIGIVESDDWVELDMFERLYDNAAKHDVDICRAKHYNYRAGESQPDANSIIEQLADRVLHPETDTEVFKLGFAVWSAIYKRSFIQNIKFLETPGASYQDISFSIIVLAMASSVYLIDCCLLHYRTDNANSSINSQAKVFCVQDEFRQVERVLALYPAKAQALQAVKNYLKIRTYFWNLRRLAKGLRKEFILGISAEMRHMLENEQIDWVGLSRKSPKRCQQIAYRPKYFAFIFNLLH
ncbi:MAG: glycosyltransferase [Deferribacteraceae bacterium]|jgi:glycosyltransferase involved in cell wall biosynthesis|nr:glycosyltransferase [Deferribacteraceae bacterium]